MDEHNELANADEEVYEEEPAEVLDHLIDELIVFAKDHDEHLTAEWIPDDGVFQITSDDLAPVEVLIVDIDDAMYGEAEAVIVESEIGPLGSDTDPLDLLRFCDVDLIYSRLALASGDDAEYLIMQAACPVSQLSAAQLDAMIREVAVFSAELRENGPVSGDEEEGSDSAE